MRMLFPEAVDPVDPATVYADLPTAAGRSSVRLNMIVSVDGGTSWNGVSGALGGPADKTLFSIMRSLTDLVLVASGTMRAEHYGPVVMTPAVQDARRARGQESVPAIAVVSSSCRFDWSSPFFTAASRRPIIVTVASADAAARRQASEVADVVVAGDDTVDLTPRRHRARLPRRAQHPRRRRSDAERRARARRLARRALCDARAVAREW